MVRQKVDERVGQIVTRALVNNERSFFVLIGKRTREQVLNLYNIRANFGASVTAPSATEGTTPLLRGKPSVCWCYKKRLDFTANKLKKAAQLRRQRKRRPDGGDPATAVEDAFWLFQQGTKVNYCRYKDSQRLLGTTCDVLVLQDFEALNPNILCRAVETVRGRGMILMLFRDLNTFKALYTSPQLDLTESYLDCVEEMKPKYSHRFIRSLTQCRNCLILNDKLEVLPIHKAVAASDESGAPDKPKTLPSPLQALRDRFSASDNGDSNEGAASVVKPILDLCVTYDQAKVVAQLATTTLAAKEDVNPGTRPLAVAVLAARGRGKSAALGLGLALALRRQLFTRIGVCAVVPENVAVVFDFLARGLEALGCPAALMGEEGYSVTKLGEEMLQVNTGGVLEDENKTRVPKSRAELVTELHYKASAALATEPALVKYVDLRSALRSSAVQDYQLLVIDEAASIPVRVMQKIMTRHQSKPVLLASTIDGYEGSGLSLTRVILKELESSSRQTLVEHQMTAPIRYAAQDPIEKWLRNFLCLNAGSKCRR